MSSRAARLNPGPLGDETVKITRTKRALVTTSSGREIRVGSIVRVKRIPPGLSKLPRDSQRAFRAIVGHRFRVAGMTAEAPRWLELNVGRIVDPLLGSFGNTVYLEPECVE